MKLLTDECFKSSSEKTTEKDGKKIEYCCYELIDGGYLYVEKEYEISDDEFKTYKEIKVICYASMEEPEMESKEEGIENMLKRLEKALNV